MTRIITREEWGAKYRNGVGTRSIGKLEKYLHHSVTAHLPENATMAQEMAQMRVLERIGQQRFGGGISYPLVFFPSGRVYQGASINRITYHSGGWRNTAGVGFCLAGNYEANTLNTKVFNAVVWALQHGVDKGWWGDPALTSYHQKFRQTACPGKYAIQQFTSLNRAGRSGATTTSKGSWFDMATKQDLRDVLKEERNQVWLYRGRSEQDAWAFLHQTHSMIKELLETVGRKVWSYHNHLTETDIYGHVRETNRAAVEIQGELAGILTALEQIGEGGEVNLEEVRKAAQEGVSAAMASLEADVTLSVNAGEDQ